MQPSRSHALSPLTKITPIKEIFIWNKIEQDFFNEIKRIVAHDTLLTYPPFNETFKIHTGAIRYQLVEVIRPKGKPIALYSGNLTENQTRYTVTERGIISIVKTLKLFRTILIGHRLRIYTDHKNLTCEGFNTYGVLRKILILK